MLKVSPDRLRLAQRKEFKDLLSRSWMNLI